VPRAQILQLVLRRVLLGVVPERPHS
jgi:hypothetical protein